MSEGSMLMRFEQPWRGVVTAPVATIAGLVVRVPPRAPVTADEVMLRLSALRRQAATVTLRPKGARIEVDDDVLVDLLTYFHGELLPLGCVTGALISANEEGAIPQLGAQLVGVLVGRSAQLTARFPPDYPVHSLAGKHAVFVVDVKQAARVGVPDLATAEGVAALNLGASLDEVMAAVVAALNAERQVEHERRQRRALVDALIETSPFELPEAFVTHQLGRRWLEREGRALARRRLSENELERSFEGWLNHLELREEVVRDAKGALLVRALLESRRITVGATELAVGAARFCAELGARTEKEALALLKKEDPASSPVINAIVLDAVLRRLASAATIQVVSQVFS